MAKQGNLKGVKRYDAPAGGWGALKATAKAVRDQMDVLEAPLLLMRTNQPDGFDCPGCAWPDKEHASTFQFCENGAKAVTWEATNKRATPEFFAGHTVSSLLAWSDHDLEDAGRLTHPMAYDRASDTYRALSWEDAFARIGQTLQALGDPNQVEFYTSGRASNEAAFLFQIFAREYGTNNFPDCSNMCHEATSVGLPLSIGIGKGTVSLEDFDHCDLILSIGHNPGTNHPRMMGTLHEASRRGAKIIALNPLKERALERFADPQSPVEMGTLGSTPIASAYHQLKVGGDAAALKGIMKAMITLDEVEGGGILDHAFIAEHTHGFAAFAADLVATPWSDITEVSGLTREALESIALACAGSKATIVAYGMGITQHARGTGAVQQIANLLLLKGHFGRPGAGICPLRGHSNVQGDRTVGITEKPSAEMIAGIERAFGFKSPTAHGHDSVAAMTAIVEGRSKVFVGLGGNFAAAMSDPSVGFAGFRGLDLAVFINTKFNRTHLMVGKEAIILPCLGRTEQDIQAGGPQSVTVEDSMSMVHASRGRLPPASTELRSEPAIIAGMARATLPDSRVAWLDLIANYDSIRDKIETVFPDFHDFNARIRHPGGFRLPLGPTERIWRTASGKAEFLVFEGLAEDIALTDPSLMKLTTVRSHDQYNTTIYGLDDRYRGIFGRRDVVFMNPSDLEARGLAPGDLIELETARLSDRPRRMRLTVVSHDIARGSLATYYPEANDLVPLDYFDPLSGTPCYKSIPVKVTMVEAGTAARSL
jgi:molybdopterin-dependent oxidoreductase alpha subunit